MSLCPGDSENAEGKPPYREGDYIQVVRHVPFTTCVLE